MAQHSLSKNFAYFFGKLNPSRTFEQKASAHYAAVKGLIEDRSGLALVLAPTCFLQGSYRNETATYTMNDIDIVALCELWQPGSGSGSGWSRDEIFRQHDGLSQSDFYQMYAYGNAGRRRYDRVVLLYPPTEPAVDRAFHQAGLALQVRQFDLKKICDPDAGRLDVDGAARELGRALSWDGHCPQGVS